jgi:TonB-dependent SusC/RagA subfamily outer membrane receptor
MLCFALNNVLGQKTVSHKADSSKNGYIIRDQATNFPSAPLYIIDDKEIPDSLANSNRALENISPDNILAISVLKDAAAATLYGVRGANGVIIITTKMYARMKYQNTFSASSKKYKRYIKNHQNNDEGLMYVLNGNLLEKTGNSDSIKKLYDIPAGAIKSVDVMDKYYKGIFNNDKPIIVITTKK